MRTKFSYIRKIVIRWNQVYRRGSLKVKNGRLYRLASLENTKVLLEDSSGKYDFKGADPFSWECKGEKGGIVFSLEPEIQGKKAPEFRISLDDNSFSFSLADFKGKGSIFFLEDSVEVKLISPAKAIAKISPESALAGSVENIRMEIKPRLMINKSGSILLATSPRTDWRKNEISISCLKSKQAKFKLVDDDFFSIREYGYFALGSSSTAVFFQLSEGYVRKDDSIIIEFNNSVLQSFIGDGIIFDVFIDYEGDKIYRRLNVPLKITLLPNTMDHFKIICPSVVRPDQNFAIILQGKDRYGNLLKKLNEQVFFYSNQKIKNLPARWKFKRNNCKIGPLQLKEAGECFIFAGNSAGDITGKSNPIVCSKQRLNVFWGSMHNHTKESDGNSRPETLYKFARENSHLDFCAISDHDDWITETGWENIKKTARKNYKENEFITFLGYETCFLKDKSGPFLRS
ncbi:MAG: hypothetical protein Q7J98_08265 [Kiritimatiellia bacterium]|nr:hypothetical protein [Kiritimatiellia bacterium]